MDNRTTKGTIRPQRGCRCDCADDLGAGETKPICDRPDYGAGIPVCAGCYHDRACHKIANACPHGMVRVDCAACDR